MGTQTQMNRIGGVALVMSRAFTSETTCMSTCSKSSHQHRFILLSLLCMSIICAMGFGPMISPDAVSTMTTPTSVGKSSPVFMSNAFLTDVPNDWDEL